MPTCLAFTSARLCVEQTPGTPNLLLRRGGTSTNRQGVIEKMYDQIRSSRPVRWTSCPARRFFETLDRSHAPCIMCRLPKFMEYCEWGLRLHGREPPSPPSRTPPLLAARWPYPPGRRGQTLRRRHRRPENRLHRPGTRETAHCSFTRCGENIESLMAHRTGALDWPARLAQPLLGRWLPCVGPSSMSGE